MLGCETPIRLESSKVSFTCPLYFCSPAQAFQRHPKRERQSLGGAVDTVKAYFKEQKPNRCFPSGRPADCSHRPHSRCWELVGVNFTSSPCEYIHSISTETSNIFFSCEPLDVRLLVTFVQVSLWSERYFYQLFFVVC